jgi:hypothetical protein
MELGRATCKRHDEPGADGIVSTREKFATIISQAVTSVPDLLAGTVRLLVMKGLQPARAVFIGLDASPDTLSIHPLEAPLLDGERHLVDVRYS